MGLDQIEAMYDFSVLMLRRAWNYPWTPDSHASFQKPFRQAIKTIALCAHRHGMPIDISITVNSYLSRDWWPDERSECWLYECQIDKLQNALFHKEESVIKQYLIKCECKVAHACSGKHMKSINREGHRRLCKTPPMRVPTAEDLAMCCQIVEKSSGDDFLQEESNEEKIEICDLDNYDNGDEECEWESIASDEESYLETKASIPEIVLKYFENKAYRIQKREEHAFANHYNTD